MKKEKVAVLKKEGVVSIEVSSSYYLRVQHLLTHLYKSALPKNAKETALNVEYLNAIKAINEKNVVDKSGKILNEFAFALETVFSLIETLESELLKNGLAEEEEIEYNDITE